MKKSMAGLILTGAVFLASYAGRYGTAVTHGGKAKITFQVLDDEQNPVPGARVQAGFYYDPEKQGIIIAETGTNGLCTVEGMTHMDMWYSIEKDGYYETTGRYLFGQVEPPVVNNRWQPWDPTFREILKKIRSPIALYVKSVNLGVPEFNKSLGFDLKEGDWLAPYGKGVVSDLIFYAELNQRSSLDFAYKLTLTFPNEKDGIQPFTAPYSSGSRLSSSHLAPDNAYLQKWEQFRVRQPGSGETNNITLERKFYFRVRTVLDNDGNIVSALYGKIYGDFLKFTYYLNPAPNDRNVEFDPDKNLFGGRDRFAP